jgi:hypothetical protein
MHHLLSKQNQNAAWEVGLLLVSKTMRSSQLALDTCGLSASCYTLGGQLTVAGCATWEGDAELSA